jgi:hypothetical protein
MKAYTISFVAFTLYTRTVFPPNNVIAAAHNRRVSSVDHTDFPSRFAAIARRSILAQTKIGRVASAALPSRFTNTGNRGD